MQSDNGDNNGNWQECKLDNSYEIWSEYPHPIRKKSTGNIVKETRSRGYDILNLSDHTYGKHVVVATQWLVNDDPEHKTEVDHINHNRSDNRVSNLRFVSRSQNNTNKATYKGVPYIYIEQLPDDAIVVDHYNKHTFTFLYYSSTTDKFYWFNGVRYRQLPQQTTYSGSVIVNIADTNKKMVHIHYNIFKQMYDLL